MYYVCVYFLELIHTVIFLLVSWVLTYLKALFHIENVTHSHYYTENASNNHQVWSIIFSCSFLKHDTKKRTECYLWIIIQKMLKIETAVSSSLLNGSHQLEMSLEHHKGKKYSYCKANIIIEEMNDNGLKEYIDKK